MFYFICISRSVCFIATLRSELGGIEGIVKLKQLDDSTLNVSIDVTDSNDALSPRTKPAYNKNATLPVDAFKLSNGFQDFEIKR